MIKKTKKLNVTWILPTVVIFFLISGFVVYDKLTFIPELTFCSSNPTESLLKIIQNLCEIPLLGRIVLILNTPGGSYEATRKIIELILASKVPIISYVYPAGGQAASAGTFIMAASHISSMSPFTSLGSATPVDIDGKDLPKTLESNLKNKISIWFQNSKNIFKSAL